MATGTGPLTLLHSWKPPGEDYIFSVAYSPDGKLLAASDEENNLLVYDMADPTAPTLKKQITVPDEYVLSVAWSPDGKYLACGTEDYNAYIYDATNSYSLAHTYI